jgi:hypothetical protein
VVEVSGKGRILVFAFGCESSGIPPNWAALVELRKPSAGVMSGISTKRTVGAERYGRVGIMPACRVSGISSPASGTLSSIRCAPA